MSQVEKLRGNGVAFVDSPGQGYYDVVWTGKAKGRMGREEFERLREAGVLIDVEREGTEEEGVLLQIFTKPIGEEPTVFLEFIERRGCGDVGRERGEGGDVEEGEGQELVVGCGGFGKGNFKALFQGIELEERRRGLVK